MKSEGYQPDPDDCELGTACACKDYDECTNELHDCTQSMWFLVSLPKGYIL